MLTNAAASALLEDAPNPAMLPPHACLLVVYYKAMEPGSTAYMQRSKNNTLRYNVVYSENHAAACYT
jgi:hypothetical protein